MTDLSSTQETQILNDIASGGVYVALHTADEGNEPTAQGGAGSTEVTAADYERGFIAEADLTVSGNAPATLTNDVPVDFGTTENDWGTVSHGSLWSADLATGGDPYTATVELGNAGSAPSGIDVTINAGELSFSLD